MMAVTGIASCHAVFEFESKRFPERQSAFWLKEHHHASWESGSRRKPSGVLGACIFLKLSLELGLLASLKSSG